MAWSTEERSEINDKDNVTISRESNVKPMTQEWRCCIKHKRTDRMSPVTMPSEDHSDVTLLKYCNYGLCWGYWFFSLCSFLFCHVLLESPALFMALIRLACLAAHNDYLFLWFCRRCSAIIRFIMIFLVWKCIWLTDWLMPYHPHNHSVKILNWYISLLGDDQSQIRSHWLWFNGLTSVDLCMVLH